MNRYLVEYIGTVFFIYVIVSTGSWLAIGAALAVAILLGGPVSGGNFNPAVSITMAAAVNYLHMMLFHTSYVKSQVD